MENCPFANPKPYFFLDKGVRFSYKRGNPIVPLQVSGTEMIPFKEREE